MHATDGRERSSGRGVAQRQAAAPERRGGGDVERSPRERRRGRRRGDERHLGAALSGFERRRGARETAADDDHLHDAKPRAAEKSVTVDLHRGEMRATERGRDRAPALFDEGTRLFGAARGGPVERVGENRGGISGAGRALAGADAESDAQRAVGEPAHALAGDDMSQFGVENRLAGAHHARRRHCAGIGVVVGEDARRARAVAESQTHHRSDGRAEALRRREHVERSSPTGQRRRRAAAGLAHAERRAEPIRRVLRHQAVGGQLAACDREESRRAIPSVIDHEVVARQLVFVLPEAPERRPNALDGVDHAVRPDRRDRALHRLEHVGDFVLGGLDAIEIAVEVVVRGAGHAVLLVRKAEHVAAVDTARIHRDVRDAALEDEMDALARAQPHLDPGQRRQLRHPGPAGVDADVALRCRNVRH